MNVVLLASELCLAPTTTQVLIQEKAATLPDVESNVELPKSTHRDNKRQRLKIDR
jgi:hypothetical protein